MNLLYIYMMYEEDIPAYEMYEEDILVLFKVNCSLLIRYVSADENSKGKASDGFIHHKISSRQKQKQKVHRSNGQLIFVGWEGVKILKANNLKKFIDQSVWPGRCRLSGRCHPCACHYLVSVWNGSCRPRVRHLLCLVGVKIMFYI